MRTNQTQVLVEKFYLPVEFRFVNDANLIFFVGNNPSRTTVVGSSPWTRTRHQSGDDGEYSKISTVSPFDAETSPRVVVVGWWSSITMLTSLEILNEKKIQIKRRFILFPRRIRNKTNFRTVSNPYTSKIIINLTLPVSVSLDVVEDAHDLNDVRSPAVGQLSFKFSPVIICVSLSLKRHPNKKKGTQKTFFVFIFTSTFGYYDRTRTMSPSTSVEVWAAVNKAILKNSRNE